MSEITNFLWFDDQAEEAADFYVALFPDSKVTNVARYGEAGPGEAGTVVTVNFLLSGRPFAALNGGKVDFAFNESISFQIDCADQAEVDHYWNGLLAGGGVESQCGWLKDRFGVSWQVVPRALFDLLGDPDPAVAQRVTTAMLKMVKLDVETLVQAAKAD
jgi:predicted 3-demethylubiquinone-9 3-methyltransferase (glyoxalase superfamily)